jgi:hypothetical protein
MADKRQGGCDSSGTTCSIVCLLGVDWCKCVSKGCNSGNSKGPEQMEESCWQTNVSVESRDA